MFINFPEVNIHIQGVERVLLPKMVKIRQQYDASVIENPADYIAASLDRSIADHSKFSGKSIAITVGSRGIPGLAGMVRSICDKLKEWGAYPFIVPSMGSHGGATAAGQLELLESYGVTEENIGVPIKSSMETVQYDDINGVPLYCDKYAFESDGIVVFNKVKPHTDFRGPHESGLVKMVAIGLANHLGASCFHSFGFERFAELLPKVGEAFLKTGKLAFGIGVVQNAYDNISDIAICDATNFMETDARLLEIAKAKLPTFKFDHIDLLIVDEIGKNISGTGCDPNIVGRNLSGTFHGMLDLQKLFVRSITPESHHSGVGLAMADMTTRECLNDVDWEPTWANVLTTGTMQGGRIPLYANTDRECILQCISTLHGSDVTNPRVVRIKNTLCMEEILVSTAIWEDISSHPEVELISDPQPMEFTSDGKLL